VASRRNHWGVIEVVETGEQVPFRTTRELWRAFLRLVAIREPTSNRKAECQQSSAFNSVQHSRHSGQQLAQRGAIDIG
jgi:hypothetical protein